MSSTSRCYACHGSKKLMGLGMIYKDCYVCDGIGYLKPVEAEPDKTHKDKINICSVADVDHTGEKHITKVDKRSKAYRESIGRKS